MASYQVLFALKRRYRLLVGELDSLRAPAARHSRLARDREKRKAEEATSSIRSAELEVDLAALEHVIWLFEPSWRARDTTGIRPMQRHTPLPHGGITQAAFEVLRTARVKMSGRGIVAEVAKRHGLDIAASSNRERFRDLVAKSLAKQSEFVACEGSQPMLYWVIGGFVDDPSDDSA